MWRCVVYFIRIYFTHTDSLFYNNSAERRVHSAGVCDHVFLLVLFLALLTLRLGYRSTVPFELTSLVLSAPCNFSCPKARPPKGSFRIYHNRISEHLAFNFLCLEGRNIVITVVDCGAGMKRLASKIARSSASTVLLCPSRILKSSTMWCLTIQQTTFRTFLNGPQARPKLAQLLHLKGMTTVCDHV